MTEPDDQRTEIIARAIKEATDKFRAPVYAYIEPEARERWEAQNPDGDWYDLPESRDELASYKIIAEAVIAALKEAS